MENNILDLELAQGLYEEKKIGELGRLLKTAEPADIALLFDVIDEEQHRLIFRLLPKEVTHMPASRTFCRCSGTRY